MKPPTIDETEVRKYKYRVGTLTGKIRKSSRIGQGTLPPDPPRDDPRHQLKWVDAVKQTPLPIPELSDSERKALELKLEDVYRQPKSKAIVFIEERE